MEAVSSSPCCAVPVIVIEPVGSSFSNSRYSNGCEDDPEICIWNSWYSNYDNQQDCEDNDGVWEPISSDIIALDMIDKIHVIGAFNGYDYHSYGTSYNLGFTLNYSTLDNYNSGDSNLDGVVNVIDIATDTESFAMTILAFILENMNISEYQFNLIDMNNDSNINIVDVITLVNVILDS